MTICSSSRVPGGSTYDVSLETRLANMEYKRDDISKSPPPPSRSKRSGLVHVLLLFLAAIFFALWIKSTQAPCPLDPLLIYCERQTPCMERRLIAPSSG